MNLKLMFSMGLHKSLGPFFFDENITCNSYLETLWDLIPEFLNNSVFDIWQ